MRLLPSRKARLKLTVLKNLDPQLEDNLWNQLFALYESAIMASRKVRPASSWRMSRVA